MYVCVWLLACRWNQLDLAIVLLSIMGITLEEIEVNASLPINPTIIRIMRVLRIARGMTLPPPLPLHSVRHQRTANSFKVLYFEDDVKHTSPGLPFLSFFAWQISAWFGQAVSRPDGTETHSQLTN